MKKFYLLIFNLFGTILVFSPFPAKAVTGLWDGLTTCRDSGTCQLSDLMTLAVNVSKIILGLCGSLALLFIVYGGIVFLISGGSREQVEKGKRIIRGAVIGLVLVFVSYTIVGFIFRALGINAYWFQGKVL